MIILESDWRWFGCAGHLIVSANCRFHLCTQVGDYLVSTVGEYFPDDSVRESLAQSRGVVLKGRGDERRADYMKKIGFEEIGYKRLYETMVFRVTGEVCHRPECACGLPEVNYSELDMDGYQTAGAATLGHMALCRKYSLAEEKP